MYVGLNAAHVVFTYENVKSCRDVPISIAADVAVSVLFANPAVFCEYKHQRQEPRVFVITSVSFALQVQCQQVLPVGSPQKTVAQE